MNPFLRRATTADANAIAHIYLTSRKELVSFAPLIHTDENIYQWICTILIHEELVIVAEDKQLIIGIMSLKKSD